MVLNNSDQRQRLKLNLSDTPLASAWSLQPLLAAQPASVQSHQVELEVAAESVAIYTAK